jgi:hypothetical protein
MSEATQLLNLLMYSGKTIVTPQKDHLDLRIWVAAWMPEVVILIAYYLSGRTALDNSLFSPHFLCYQSSKKLLNMTTVSIMVDDTDPRIEYSGSWTRSSGNIHQRNNQSRTGAVYNNTLHSSTKNGTSFSFQFNGEWIQSWKNILLNIYFTAIVRHRLVGSVWYL